MNASQEHRAPLIHHVTELRSRLMWSLLFITAGAVAGYFLRGYLMYVVQKPLNETLYYTDPTGALTFVIKICVVFGLLFGLPAVMYHVFGFFGPLLSNRTKKMTVMYTFFSVVLAITGACFAYFFTLPAALHFLVGFSSDSIKSLITANEYFNFAFAYILGFALLFQIPLILLFINRITRLKPSKMFGAMRHVIVISFVIAAIITPTPDPMNQALMALPAILLYLASIIILTIVNRPKLRRRAKLVVHMPKAAMPVVIPAQPKQLYKPMKLRTAPQFMTKQRVISDFI